jgi:hypothetical protein
MFQRRNEGMRLMYERDKGKKEGVRDEDAKEMIHR